VNKHEYAAIDRISNGIATLLVGAVEIIVDLDTLPEGVIEGGWLKVDAAGNFVAAPEMTMERKKVLRWKLNRLRNRKASA